MTEQRKRARRDERPARPKPIRITERDLDVLEMVAACRVLTTEHIQALFFPSMHQTYARLRALYDHALLDRQFRGLYIDKMNSPIMYVIDKQGVELLQTTRNPNISWNPDRKDVSQNFLDHALAINDVRVAATIACREHPDFTLLEWRGESEMKADYDYVTIQPRPNSAPKRASLIPDSYFVIDTPRGKANCFLELDRGTESLPRFREKILIYQAYYRSGMYQKRYGATGMRLLTVTTSEERAKNLKALAEEVGVGNRFWFTSLQQVQADTILLAPIWQVASFNVHAPLVDLH